MGKLLVILFSSPLQSQNIHTVYELAQAALEMKHEVTLFCDDEATYNLMIMPKMSGEATPAVKLEELVKKGVHVLACRESARIRGIDAKTDFIQGVVESSLGKLAELMEQHDRIVAFG
jgi:sulfur relay (sulfurtransferase) complex TusBCD TusD component (DsrE family)